ncbi:unnamed protein product, partial [Clonostachys rhizophaga]
MDPKRRAGSRAAPRAPRPSIQRRPQLPNPRTENSFMQMEPQIIFTQPKHPSTALELHRLGQEPPVPVRYNTDICTFASDQPYPNKCHKSANIVVTVKLASGTYSSGREAGQYRVAKETAERSCQDW